MRTHLIALEEYKLDEKIGSPLWIADARAVLLKLFKHSCSEEDLEDTMMMSEVTVACAQPDADSSKVFPVPTRAGLVLREVTGSTGR